MAWRLWACALPLAIAIGCSLADAPTPERTAASTSALTTSPVYTWRMIDTPGLASHRTLVYDTARGRITQWEGATSTLDGPLTGTWLWNGATWSQAPGTEAPQPASAATMTYDSRRLRAVLFVDRQTWEWDGTVWAQRMPKTLPPMRGNYWLAYDSDRGKTVLFSGYTPTTNTVHRDTWEWDGSDWTDRTPSASPPGRLDYGMAYDSTRHRIVMYGGVDAGTVYGDIWEWDGTSWTQRMIPSPPTARYGAELAYDTTRNKMVMFGGHYSTANASNETWEYDGTAWAKITTTGAPSARGEFGFAYDSDRRRFVLMGGPAIVDDPDTRDTWEYDAAATTWTKRADVIPVLDRRGAAFAFDTVRGVAVRTGGTDGTSLFDDTSEWNGSTWTTPTLSPKPPARQGASLAFDAARRVAVLFGGTSNQAATNYLADTWEYDGTWRAKTPTQSPSARAEHALAYDPVRQVVVLFGGRSGATYYDETWEYAGATWTKKLPAHSPGGRRRHTMQYDATARAMVVFGGLLTTSTVTGTQDTWTWDGVDWTEHVFADPPPTRYEASGAADGAHVYLYGGQGYNGQLDDLWSYASTGWTRLRTDVRPKARRNALLAFDTVRNSLFLAGGVAVSPGGTTAFTDNWYLTMRAAGCATSADCPGAFCTDGVCCTARECSSCETCSGTTPGVCAPVTNATDDTCSGDYACDRAGACKKVQGQPAASAADCASGFFVDGVCCDTACDGTCVACEASKKASGSRTGVCDYAKDNTDPHDSCEPGDKSTCGSDGMCDGNGLCRKYAKGTACGAVSCTGARLSGRICDGRGTCADDAAGVVCTPFACTIQGCASGCTSDAQCQSAFRCASGSCVPTEGAVCASDHAVRAPSGEVQECSKYYGCKDGACNTVCKTNAECSYPNECSFDGRCVAFQSNSGGGGGCSIGRARDGGPRGVLLALAVAVAVSGARRSRRGQS